jgi:aminoglycoside 6'-N-acetyltransferase
MGLPTLRGERLVLRPLVEQDLDALLDILAEPEVARWWGPQAEQPDREELLGPEARFAIVVDAAVAGWLACEENGDPMYRSVGLDIFLTTPLHGQGLGREALRLAIAPVGRMRDYELGADGTWHDGLLMDLLADEFVRA